MSFPKASSFVIFFGLRWWRVQWPTPPHPGPECGLAVRARRPARHRHAVAPEPNGWPGPPHWTLLQFLKPIQYVRGIIKAAESDLLERQAEKGAFAGRIAFRGATERLKRLVRPAQSVQCDSVIVPYPRVLGSEFECPFILLPGFLESVQRQQYIAAMLQRGHVPGIQRDAAINVAQGFRKTPLFVPGDRTQPIIDRKGRKFYPIPVGQGNRGHNSHACRKAKRPAPTAAADRFNESQQAAAADGRHDRPERITETIADEERDIGCEIKGGINQQNKKRVAIPTFGGRPDSGWSQHEQHDPAHGQQTQPDIFRLQKSQRFQVGHFGVPKHQPGFFDHQPDPGGRGGLDFADGPLSPVLGDGHGICVRLAALRAHRRHVFLARPHFRRLLAALVVIDVAVQRHLYPVRPAFVAQIKIHAAGRRHDLEVVRLHLVDKAPRNAHDHPADQPHQRQQRAALTRTPPTPDRQKRVHRHENENIRARLRGERRQAAAEQPEQAGFPSRGIGCVKQQQQPQTN